MKRLGAKLGLASLCIAAVAARADFRPLSVPGTPTDTEIIDAGQAAIVAQPAVATDDAGFELLDPDGGSLFLGRAIAAGGAAGGLVSAFIEGPNCLSGLTNKGVYLTTPPCGPFPGAPINFTRVRHSASGAAYGTGSQGTSPTQAAFGFSSGAGASWIILTGSTAPSAAILTPSVSALRLSAVEYGLFGFKLAKVQLATNGGAPSLDIPTRVTSVTEAQLFAGAGSLAGLIGGDGGLDVLFFDAGTPVVAPLVGFDTVTGIAYATGTGDGLYGEGFGMLIVQDAGVPGLLYRAVPDPRNLGSHWVPSSLAAPATAGPLDRVSCLGAQFCVLLANASAGVNALVYRNRQPPWVDFPTVPFAQVAEGTSLLTSVDAGDNDGDAVFLTWDPSPTAPLGVTPLASSPERKAILIGADAGSPLLCNQAFVDFPLTVHASDGLAGHENATPYVVRILHTLASLPPSVVPQGVHLLAGSGPFTFSALPPGSVCIPANYAWTLVSGSEFSWSPSGASLVVTPSDTFCTPPSQAASFQVRGVENGGLTSAPAALTFFVDPTLPGVGPLVPPTIQAACGAPAQGMVRVAVEPGQCPVASYQWQQQSGPPATVVAQDAHDFVIATQQTDFNSLVGQHLVFGVTADAGPGNTRSAVRDVEIVSPLFVEVRHFADPPIGSDSSILGIQVALANPTACAIAGVEFDETLDGLRYVPNSARAGGLTAAASVGGDSLIFPGLILPAHGSLLLSYQARPRLLSSHRPSGVAMLNQVPISLVQGFAAPPGTACGCSEGTGPAALATLAAFGVAVRKRVRKRSTGRS